VEEQVVVDELLPRDDAEEVDQPLGLGAHDGGDVVAAGAGVEDGEVHVRVGVGGVVQPAPRHRVRRAPRPQDAVHVQEVRQEGAVLVPALAGARGAKDGGELGQSRVGLLLLAAKERPGCGQQFVQRLVGRHGCKDLLLLQLGGTSGCRQLGYTGQGGTRIIRAADG
jgi:hypothetical protein